MSRPIDECFTYIADFTSTAEWDATAFQATKTTRGPIAIGTEFLVRCRLPLGAIDLAYTVTEFDPPSLITLEAKSWLFEAVDRIDLESTAEGTLVRYTADFQYREALTPFEPALRLGMKRMGRVAVQGLGRALEDRFESPKISAGSAAADRLVWPGLALFSKLGYQRGKRRFKPISASMKDRHVLITGASSGLGLATARDLARRGADLTLVMRDPTKAKAVVANLKKDTGNPHIRYELADLALMTDVDALAERLLEAGRPIDVLVNNAGALFNDWGQTSEGLEQSFALLLLSPWRLSNALYPLLRKSQDARVINVVSGGMYSQKLEVERLEAAPEGYGGATAYARCKRALTVVTEELAHAWADDDIVVNAMHPGWADTPGVETALPGFHSLTKRILRSAEEGADTIIWLAAATEAREATGRLFLDREPRTTHLLPLTAETREERQKLMAFLNSYLGADRAA